MFLPLFWLLGFGLYLWPLLTDGLNNPYCTLSCEFNNNTYIHTVCKRDKEKCGPDKKCGPDFKVIEMTDEIRQSLLDLHNELRNKVASGNETRNDQPPATNMNVLKYDRELEFLAQCWVNDCNGNPLIHDSCRSTKQFYHVGQNLGFINSSTAEIDYKSSMAELVTNWYDEVEIFKNEWVNYTDDRGPDIKVGHYTQVIWADTKNLGCAGSYYTSVRNKRKWHYFLFACNYGPGGNYITLPAYDIGEPCSNCNNNDFCNSDYESLCGESVSVNETLEDFQPLYSY